MSLLGAGAFALGGGDEEIVAVDGEGGGVPVGGDETDGPRHDSGAR